MSRNRVLIRKTVFLKWIFYNRTSFMWNSKIPLLVLLRIEPNFHFYFPILFLWLEIIYQTTYTFEFKFVWYSPKNPIFWNQLQIYSALIDELGLKAQVFCVPIQLCGLELNCISDVLLVVVIFIYIVAYLVDSQSIKIFEKFFFWKSFGLLICLLFLFQLPL